MDIFEQASRNRLRFTTSKGELSVEDLWSLPLRRSASGAPNLDDLAKSVNKQVRESSEESFVSETPAANEKAVLALEIIKRVISVKLEQEKERKNAAARKEQKELIASIIAEKSHEELKGKGLEELQKLHDSL